MERKKITQTKKKKTRRHYLSSGFPSTNLEQTKRTPSLFESLAHISLRPYIHFLILRLSRKLIDPLSLYVYLLRLDSGFL